VYAGLTRKGGVRSIPQNSIHRKYPGGTERDLLHRIETHWWGGAVNHLDSNNLSEAQARDARKCPRCETRLWPPQIILDSRRGKIIHLFECPCGERIWDD
jgi:hypothetical protein